MKTCGKCDNLDRTICYPTSPPQFDCTVTGQCHTFDHVCDVEPDEDKNVPGKPLSEWTLGEIREVCDGRRCKDCPFYLDIDHNCMVDTTPNDWNLEYIPQVPPLTEAEINIMRALGAKWASRDDDPDINDGVELWGKKPDKVKDRWCDSSGALASIAISLFPSVKPGDCIGLRDMKDDEV